MQRPQWAIRPTRRDAHNDREAGARTHQPEKAAVMTDRIPFRVQPMLATLVSRPFHKAGWVYEEKYDGFRMLAYKEGARITLLSRSGKNRTQTYATIAAAVAKLADPKPIVDIEHIRREYHEAKEAK